MQLSTSALFSIAVIAVSICSAAGAAIDGEYTGMTSAQFENWLATTDAKITYVGTTAEHMKRNPLSIRVVYCSTRSGPLCGGNCSVYDGGATCLNAPDTNCLSASKNVSFCGSPKCGGTCNQFNSCGTKLDNGFCYTPATKSIAVPPS